jgi:hypothetical protein
MDHPENFSLIWSHGGNKFHSKSDQFFVIKFKQRKLPFQLTQLLDILETNRLSLKRHSPLKRNIILKT